MDFRKVNRDSQWQSEREMLDRAAELALEVELKLDYERPDPRGSVQSDALVTLERRGRSQRFACEIKSINTPQAIANASVSAQLWATRLEMNALVIAPYLSEDKMKQLLDQQVSSIDLCGNVCVESGDFLVWRTGRPNLFKQPSSPINPFRGDNSIFSRCFLLRDKFESLTELQAFAQSRLLPRKGLAESEVLRLGTASKTVQALEQELIVRKQGANLKLMDRERLLSSLRRDYQAPAKSSQKGKFSVAPTEVRGLLEAAGVRVAATGLYSATHYGVLSPAEKLSLYVDDLEGAKRALEFREQTAFANCELIETTKNYPFFDVTIKDQVPYASRVQTWLELSHGNSREQEAGTAMFEGMQLQRLAK